MSIKVNLDSYRAVARAIAAGRMVFCVETHEGWQMEGGCSLNYARKRADVIVHRWLEDIENPHFYALVTG